MTVGDAGLEAGGVAGPQHRFAIVLAQGDFAFEHIDEFVFVQMPVPQRRRRARLERAEIDAELRQPGGVAEALAPRPSTALLCGGG